MRPFDAARDGQVWGEGAAAFILESRSHARAPRGKHLGTLAQFGKHLRTPPARP